MKANRETAASGKGGRRMTTGKQVVVIVEVGEDYTDQLHVIDVDQCSMEEAQQIARDLGYRVIGELCAVVDTIDETHIIVTVEPEEEEEEEITWAEIMDKARHLALNSDTFTDNPKKKASDVYLVKDIRLVVDAFAKDIEEGKLGSYDDPASFLDRHGIEWE